MLDAQELADELAERLAIITIDGGRSDREAIAFLLHRYPLTRETAASWQVFLEGAANPHNALPIEAAVAAELRQLLSNAEEEAEQAKPDREALRQYIDLGFTLYAQAETQGGRRFADWRTGKPSKQPQSAIRTIEELYAALKNGIRLFSFLPSERGFVCIDVDRGHENGIDGWASYHAFLRARGIEADPLSEAKVIVDTPSGGNHLYFLARGDGIRHEAKLCANVEAFGTGSAKPLTAAGSVKKGKAYVLHGHLSDATVIPRKLNNWLAKRAVTEQAQSSARFNQAKGSYSHTGKKSRGDYPLEQLVEWGIENANSDSRHINAFYIGMSVGSAYPLSEVKAACYRNGKFADRRDFSDSELEYQLNRGIAKSDFR